jgi:2-polyprenyl-3-methyl-5-hydroxy-6-metoxy-1,4-benzoquinol methylase
MDHPQHILQRMLYRFAKADSVRTTQGRYVRFFQEIGARRVLDLGCGRGIFLELLRDGVMSCTGVDTNLEAAEECRQKGFPDVEVGDAIGYLKRKIDAGVSFDGVFCAHLIEHLQPEQAAEIICYSARLLSAGGRFVVITPNVANLEVWTNIFWMDPTHRRPYPRPLIEAMMQEVALTISASFDDPLTGNRYLGRDILHLLPAVLRYGSNVIAGIDSIVVGDRLA